MSESGIGQPCRCRASPKVATSPTTRTAADPVAGSFASRAAYLAAPCNAGRIWQATFDEFLLGYGLRQLISDRRVWVIRTALGDLIIHDHVGDSRFYAS
jgi:hypothetical protein